MAANPGFPLVLDVKSWTVLVIGGDEEAAEKTERLLASGARVTVISPTLNEPLRHLAASGKVIHRGRHFRDADLDHQSQRLTESTPTRQLVRAQGEGLAVSREDDQQVGCVAFEGEAAAIAFLVSGILSFFFLDRQRDALGQSVGNVFQRLNARIEANTRKEDLD